MGRVATGKYDIAKMVEIIDDYTDKTSVPILKEICYQNHWYYDYVMQLQRNNEDLTHSIKRLLDKKEVALERGMISGDLKATACIFSLKQLGWKDKQEIEYTAGELQPLKIEFIGNNTESQDERLRRLEEEIKEANK